MRIGVAITVGGFVEVASIEQAELCKEMFENNDYEEIEEFINYTHFEAVTWDE